MSELKKLMENTWNYSQISDPIRIATWTDHAFYETSYEDNYMYGFPLVRKNKVTLLGKNSKPGKILNFKRKKHPSL